MSATKPLSNLIGISPYKLSKEESVFLEAEIILRICHELKEFFRKKYKEYFHLLKLTIEKENAMLDTNLIRCIIKDILATEEYTLEGIAYYTNTHQDILDEVMIGRNMTPSFTFFLRMIELHREVR